MPSIPKNSDNHNFQVNRRTSHGEAILNFSMKRIQIIGKTSFTAVYVATEKGQRLREFSHKPSAVAAICR